MPGSECMFYDDGCPHKVWAGVDTYLCACTKEEYSEMHLKNKTLADIIPKPPSGYITNPPEFKKFDQGKPAYHLLMPEFLDGVAKVLEFGARKYEPNNWARGAEWSRYFAALQRHMWAWWGGEDNDPETGMSHLYHAGCCLMFLSSYLERGLGDDDRFNPSE